MAERIGIQTKLRIIEIASEMFGRRGFEKVTVKQIGNRLQITEPAIYRYFPSKEALCDAVLLSLSDRLQHEAVFAEDWGDKDVEVLLERLALHIIKFFSSRPEMYRLLLFSALQKRSKAHRAYKAIRGKYSQYLCEQLDLLRAKGLIVKKNNEITARCFIAMVFDCALAGSLWKGMQGKVYAPRELVANNVATYAYGLKPARKQSG